MWEGAGPPPCKESSWLLLFGCVALLLLRLRTRPRWPIGPRHQAVVHWGGWLLAGAIFFSVGNSFHEYYLSMLGAPLVAPAGIGVAEVWRLWHERWWLALGALLLAVGSTLALQYATLQAFVGLVWWLPVVAGLFIAGAVLTLLAQSQQERLARTGVV